MQKSLDAKGRTRNKNIGFRVSEEEAKQINELVALSGLKKQEYIMSRLLNREIVVSPNPRVYMALKNRLEAVYGELKRIETCGQLSDEFIEMMNVITGMLSYMKGNAGD